MKFTDRAVAAVAVLVVVGGVMLFENARSNKDHEAWSQSAVRALAAATCDALSSGNAKSSEVGETDAAADLMRRLTEVQTEFEGNDLVRVFNEECRKRLDDAKSAEEK
jgi:hypothetical protein